MEFDATSIVEFDLREGETVRRLTVYRICDVAKLCVL